MTTPHSDPPPERTAKRSEVLSDATDLDALLHALLGDQASPLPLQTRPRDEATGWTVAERARPEPPIGAPPRTAVDRDDAFALKETTEREAGWGFASEDEEDGNAIARDVGAVPERAAASVVLPFSPPWRDKLRVSLSKPYLIVAALLATVLTIVGAISLRGARADTATPPSSDAPAVVQGAPSVERPSAVNASGPPEVEVWAAAREPKEQPRVVSRIPSRRATEATDRRSSAPPKPAIIEVLSSEPTASPVVASPAPVERTTEPTDRDAAPSRPTPASEQRRSTDSASTTTASGASATSVAEPAPAAAAPPVPAGLPRQTAPRLLIGSAPEYPAALRTARIGGSVEVRFTIDRSGGVSNVRSLSGPLQLRSAAEAAVRRWRYEAARVDNLAVETQTSVRFNFDPATTRRPQE